MDVNAICYESLEKWGQTDKGGSLNAAPVE